jgi:DNA invertase Pin-like site-specific DNA recombinase
MEQVVSYIRVSTQRQGTSGLGLEGQRTAVNAFCVAHGVRVLREYQDVESGRHDAREGLKKAIAHARRAKATLLIAKLDRLARNVAFVANLMESDVEFTACDLPSANRLLLHVMAAVAEAEARSISERTIAALTAAKARGKPLGATNPRSRNLSVESMSQGRKQGSSAMASAARAYYADVAPEIRRMRSEGKSFAAIALDLNDSGFTLRSGKPWNAVQVKRVLDRAY